jgi:hypothetical protein
MQIGTIFQTAALLDLPAFHPRQTKPRKDMIPQSRSHIIMKKVVYSFPISFAQIASIHNDDLSLPEIIRCNNLSKGSRPRDYQALTGFLGGDASRGMHYLWLCSLQNVN